jgi:uncharacterized protein YbjT (DUF2867 family)
MKIIVTGSLGNISKPLTTELVQKGHTVTVISSKADKQKNIETLGANAAIGSIEDADFLTATFMGADAIYTMVPPKGFLDQNFDVIAYYDKIGTNYAQAIRQSGIKRVVHLSSIGADLDKGTGLILGHNKVEGILNNLLDIAITYMRPTAFHYNLYSFLPAIKNTGSIASNYGAEDKIVWVSPIDIAAAVAAEIVTPLKGKKVLYVASDELTCIEVAGILGAAIGKPDLKWVLIPDEQVQHGLEAFGLSKQVAAALVELNASMHKGKFFDDYYQNRPQVMGKVTMTDFAKEFAATYNKG